MTNRFITAAENPYVNIIGHPLTRKLGRRPPVDVDLDALYEACARTGTALEINASPARMDLPPRAHRRGPGRRGEVRDRHRRALARRPEQHARYGVAAARLGGLTPDDVINAWPLEQLRRIPPPGPFELKVTGE